MNPTPDFHRREAVAVVALVAAMAALLAIGLRSDGLTIDEIVYIGSGYRHVTALDYRLNPEQPPVAKLLGAVPLTALALRIGPEDSAQAGEWSWGYLLVHEWNDAVRVVSAARVPNVLLTLLLALLVWRWSREQNGPAAGIAGLVLIAFHPSLLAHGHLLTTDLPGALTMVAASWAFWRWSAAPTAGRAALVGVALAIAVTTRITNWLLVPSFVFLFALRLPERRRAETAKAVKAFLRLAIVAGVGVWLGIWALYGFRYLPWPGVSIAQPPGPELGLGGRLVAALEANRVLPEAYLEGARFVLEHNATGHQTYLLGHTSLRGWPWYYLVAVLVKNTEAFLAAVTIALVLVARRFRAVAEGSIEAHWLVPALAMFGAASAGHIQIGERYVLPIYPYLILLVAAQAPVLWARRGGRLIVVLLGLGHAGAALVAQPHGHLAYFNQLAGGPAGGYRVLADSNLDWGQDLPRLAAWMRRTGTERVLLGYHGSDRPERFGIVHDDLPGMLLYPTRPAQPPLSGVAAVSPNLALGIFGVGDEIYSRLRSRPPDDRAGVYLIYRLRPGEIP